jgi:hypothetical protein
MEDTAFRVVTGGGNLAYRDGLYMVQSMILALSP